MSKWLSVTGNFMSILKWKTSTVSTTDGWLDLNLASLNSSERGHRLQPRFTAESIMNMIPTAVFWGGAVGFRHET